MGDKRRRVALLFLLGLLVTVVVAEAAARFTEAAGPPVLRWYDAATQLKVEQMDDLGDADVVFAGTSMVWQGLVPGVFTGTDPERRTTYNAGLAGGVPVVMEPWLLEEVVPRLQPDLVVWGLSSMDFSTSYGHDNLDRYRDALDSRTGALATIEQTTARFSALVRYRTILRHPNALFGSERDGIEDDFVDAAAVLGNGGERLDFETATSPDRARQIQARLHNYRIDPIDIDALYRTVNALRHRGIEVVLAEMPIPNRYVFLHPEGAADTARAHETIVAISDVFGLPLIDLRYGFTDDDFIDFTHLNQAAAGILTTQLTAALTNATLQPSEPEASDPTPSGPQVTAPTTTTTTTSTTVPGPPVESLLSTANRVIDVNNRLYHHLHGGGDILRTPAYWTSSDHAGRHGDMANAVANGGFEVVMIGSSIVVNGFDPVLFTELDNRTAFNAGLAAMGPERLSIWLESVLRLTDPDLVVYGVAPRDIRSRNRVEGACTDSVDDWEWSERLRTEAFAPVDALNGLWWEHLLFGDPVHFEAPPLYRSEFNEFGGRRAYNQMSEAEILQAAANSAWTGPLETCPERFEALAANVERLYASGITTVVVFMPMSSTRVGMFEGGRAEVDAILAEMEAVVTAAGATAVLDMSAVVPDDQFRDLNHTNRTGARTFTDELAARLTALGM
jgi:hypothetical protein